MKTPILRPATEAVLFGFERIGMVVRIAWLPILLAMALYVAVAMSFIGGAVPNLPVFDGDDPQEALQSIFQSGGFTAFYALQMTILPLLSSLILSCVYVAITRASTLADYEPPKLPFYFALGPREIRYFIVRVLYALLIMAVVIVTGGLGAAVAAAAVGMVAGVEGQTAAIIIAPTAAIIIGLLLIALWVVVRFLPVLAIAAVENRIAFGDAWKMTKGNFWRILLSGAMFVAILQGALMVLIVAVLAPAAIVIGLIAAFGYGFARPAALSVFALFAVVLIPAIFAIAAFGVAAQAAFPGRIYAYLSGCGDACKI